MKYTITPLENPNDSHVGFWFLTVAVFCSFALINVARFDETKDIRCKTFAEYFFCIILPIVLIAAAFHESYIKQLPVPTNIPVVGKLVGDYSQEEKSGKVMINVAYVVYSFPEGEVSFQRSSGVVYPKTATFYLQK